MKKLIARIALVAFVAVFGTCQARAANIMPDFSTVPTGWTTDRYAPDSFSNVGTFQGRNDVLGIGISSLQSLANRPGGYQSTFYNTQGMAHTVTGGAGSTLSADLYIPAAWGNEANGDVRTDMWGVMTDATSNVSAYPIIGFTNYGGTPEFRVWDQNGFWANLSTPVSYDQWTSLSIQFDGSAFKYSINGTTVYTDSGISGSTGFSAVIMQAYNFGDPSLAPTVPNDYTAHWSNASAVPEPSSIVLAGLGGLGLAIGAIRRRRQQNAAV